MQRRSHLELDEVVPLLPLDGDYPELLETARRYRHNIVLSLKHDPYCSLQFLTRVPDGVEITVNKGFALTPELKAWAMQKGLWEEGGCDLVFVDGMEPLNEDDDATGEVYEQD